MSYTPLAEQFRPKQLSEIIGQDHLVGPKGFITGLIQKKKPLSILLWGPPGSGKTSIAQLYAKAFGLKYESISPIFNGIADLKKIIKDSESHPLFGRTLLLFVDEIHRFNKAQQDAFLPYLESGKIIMIGATIENPSFYLNAALLSRLRVLKLNPLSDEALDCLISKYESQRHALNLTPEARGYLIQASQGDGRYLFNLLENVETLLQENHEPITLERLEETVQKRPALFDRGADQHYNLISALHKAVRGSDPDAGLYWLCRMLEGGEEPLFIARRCIRMASEDIGLADPQALPLAIAARDAYEMLGSPEGELALAQIVVYLALAPKSNAVYTAYNRCREAASQTTHMDPPAIILNAPTKTMKELGYGKGYVYDHDTPQGFSGQNYFPPDLGRQDFYHPVERGFEREMSKRMEYFRKLRERLTL